MLGQFEQVQSFAIFFFGKTGKVFDNRHHFIFLPEMGGINHPQMGGYDCFSGTKNIQASLLIHVTTAYICHHLHQNDP
jgi:hypothetical protein